MSKCVVMIGTDLRAPGGMTAVVQAYRQAGLFERWPVWYLGTFHHNRTGNKLKVALLCLLRFLGLLLTRRVRGLHAHVAARGSFWRKSIFLLLARWASVPTILHLHDGSFPAWYAEKLGPGRRWLVRWMLRSVDRVVVLSEGWAGRIAQIEPAARLAVVHNPVLLPRGSPQPEAGEVLFLARLWPEKGIYDLLDAAAQLVAKGVHLRLVCAGDGDKAAVSRRAQELGLSAHLSLPGWIESERKAELLSRAAVFVLPSYFEGVPIGVLEAMAWGVPVLASDVGGIAEAMGAEAGICFSAGDVPALAQGMERLLADAALRARMGAAGRERVERCFAAEHVVDQVDKLYRELGFSGAR